MRGSSFPQPGGAGRGGQPLSRSPLKAKENSNNVPTAVGVGKPGPAVRRKVADVPASAGQAQGDRSVAAPAASPRPPPSIPTVVNNNTPATPIRAPETPAFMPRQPYETQGAALTLTSFDQSAVGGRAHTLPALPPVHVDVDAAVAATSASAQRLSSMLAPRSGSAGKQRPLQSGLHLLSLSPDSAIKTPMHVLLKRGGGVLPLSDLLSDSGSPLTILAGPTAHGTSWGPGMASGRGGGALVSVDEAVRLRAHLDDALRLAAGDPAAALSAAVEYANCLALLLQSQGARDAAAALDAAGAGGGAHSGAGTVQLVGTQGAGAAEAPSPDATRAEAALADPPLQSTCTGGSQQLFALADLQREHEELLAAYEEVLADQDKALTKAEEATAALAAQQEHHAAVVSGLKAEVARAGSAAREHSRLLERCVAAEAAAAWDKTAAAEAARECEAAVAEMQAAAASAAAAQSDAAQWRAEAEWLRADSHAARTAKAEACVAQEAAEAQLSSIQARSVGQAAAQQAVTGSVVSTTSETIGHLQGIVDSSKGTIAHLTDELRRAKAAVGGEQAARAQAEAAAREARTAASVAQERLADAAAAHASELDATRAKLQVRYEAELDAARRRAEQSSASAGGRGGVNAEHAAAQWQERVAGAERAAALAGAEAEDAHAACDSLRAECGVLRHRVGELYSLLSDKEEHVAALQDAHALLLTVVSEPYGVAPCRPPWAGGASMQGTALPPASPRERQGETRQAPGTARRDLFSSRSDMPAPVALGSGPPFTPTPFSVTSQAAMEAMRALATVACEVLEQRRRSDEHATTARPWWGQGVAADGARAPALASPAPGHAHNESRCVVDVGTPLLEVQAAAGGASLSRPASASSALLPALIDSVPHDRLRLVLQSLFLHVGGVAAERDSLATHAAVLHEEASVLKKALLQAEIDFMHTLAAQQHGAGVAHTPGHGGPLLLSPSPSGTPTELLLLASPLGTSSSASHGLTRSAKALAVDHRRLTDELLALRALVTSYEHELARLTASLVSSRHAQEEQRERAGELQRRVDALLLRASGSPAVPPAVASTASVCHTAAAAFFAAPAPSSPPSAEGDAVGRGAKAMLSKASLAGLTPPRAQGKAGMSETERLRCLEVQVAEQTALFQKIAAGVGSGGSAPSRPPPSTVVPGADRIIKRISVNPSTGEIAMVYGSSANHASLPLWAGAGRPALGSHEWTRRGGGRDGDTTTTSDDDDAGAGGRYPVYGKGSGAGRCANDVSGCGVHDLSFGGQSGGGCVEHADTIAAGGRAATEVHPTTAPARATALRSEPACLNSSQSSGGSGRAVSAPLGIREGDVWASKVRNATALANLARMMEQQKQRGSAEVVEPAEDHAASAKRASIPLVRTQRHKGTGASVEPASVRPPPVQPSPSSSSSPLLSMDAQFGHLRADLPGLHRRWDAVQHEIRKDRGCGRPPAPAQLDFLDWATQALRAAGYSTATASGAPAEAARSRARSTPPLLPQEEGRGAGTGTRTGLHHVRASSVPAVLAPLPRAGEAPSARQTAGRGAAPPSLAPPAAAAAHVVAHPTSLPGRFAHPPPPPQARGGAPSEGWGWGVSTTALPHQPCPTPYHHPVFAISSQPAPPPQSVQRISKPLKAWEVAAQGRGGGREAWAAAGGARAAAVPAISPVHPRPDPTGEADDGWRDL